MENAATSWPVGCRVRPMAEIVAAASSMPSSMLPVSPMMIRAGWKFQGRNPTQAPATTAHRTGAACSVPRPLIGGTRYA